MSLLTYKVIHILGLLLTFIPLGALALHAMNGGDRESNRSRKWVMVSHGVGLVLLLVSGFGMLARLQIGHGEPWPAWVWIKIVIWVTAGGLVALVVRVPRLARLWWVVVPLLGTVAAWVALYKPGL